MIVFFLRDLLRLLTNKRYDCGKAAAMSMELRVYAQPWRLFFVCIRLKIKMDADLLRWLSTPRPRLVLSPLGEKLARYSMHHGMCCQGSLIAWENIYV